jgi:transposase
MQIAVLGIDLGKNSCSIVGLDVRGAVVLRRRMRREGIIKLAAKLKPCVAAIEACCGAHHLGRVLRAQGHEVRLMSPEYVRPYVKCRRMTIAMRKRSPRRQRDRRCGLSS